MLGKFQEIKGYAQIYENLLYTAFLFSLSGTCQSGHGKRLGPEASLQKQIEITPVIEKGAPRSC